MQLPLNWTLTANIKTLGRKEGVLETLQLFDPFGMRDDRESYHAAIMIKENRLGRTHWKRIAT